MTSVARNASQIGAREKYFLAIASTDYRVPNNGANIYSVMLNLDFLAATSGNVGISSSMYRDMGKEVNGTDGSGRYIVKYRLVQRVAGVETEGVPADYDEYGQFYIRVWAADPVSNPVTVARVG